MKKLITLVLAMVCVLGLAGCAQQKATSGDLPPMLVMNNCNYIAREMPVNELPEDFECMGEITEKEANDTGLQGCQYYANKYISSFDEFYVYQECGTPIDENTLDPEQRQWAYVKWVREGFHSEETDIESSEEVIVRGDLPPMVKVNGELYLDTGHESTVKARCGMMDGEITSTVDMAEQPIKDNESNFGTGYGYQYGSHEGLIEVCMNGKWWVFATEKALLSSQVMTDPVAQVSIQNIFTGESADITENEDIEIISNILFTDS